MRRKKKRSLGFLKQDSSEELILNLNQFNSNGARNTWTSISRSFKGHKVLLVVGDQLRSTDEIQTSSSPELAGPAADQEASQAAQGEQDQRVESQPYFASRCVITEPRGPFNLTCN